MKRFAVLVCLLSVAILGTSANPPISTPVVAASLPDHSELDALKAEVTALRLELTQIKESVRPVELPVSAPACATFSVAPRQSAAVTYNRQVGPLRRFLRRGR